MWFPKPVVALYKMPYNSSLVRRGLSQTVCKSWRFTQWGPKPGLADRAGRHAPFINPHSVRYNTARRQQLNGASPIGTANRVHVPLQGSEELVIKMSLHSMIMQVGRSSGRRLPIAWTTVVRLVGEAHLVPVLDVFWSLPLKKLNCLVA